MAVDIINIISLFSTHLIFKGCGLPAWADLSFLRIVRNQETDRSAIVMAIK